jgi:hypothetical protein
MPDYHIFDTDEIPQEQWVHQRHGQADPAEWYYNILCKHIITHYVDVDK